MLKLTFIPFDIGAIFEFDRTYDKIDRFLSHPHVASTSSIKEKCPFISYNDAVNQLFEDVL